MSEPIGFGISGTLVVDESSDRVVFDDGATWSTDDAETVTLHGLTPTTNAIRATPTSSFAAPP